jgi:hypothetical protein
MDVESNSVTRKTTKGFAGTSQMGLEVIPLIFSEFTLYVNK